MQNSAFVTGGTGFIGINLIHRLVQEGWNVTALHRNTSDLTYIEELPITLREGSITDPESLEAAMPGDTDVVFHLAGSTNMWSRNNDLQTRINVNGTEHTARIAAQKGANSFIHTSSIAAWGNMDGEISEATPQKGGRSWVNYESSKYEGEQRVLRYKGDMKVVILNPSFVVGPYDKNNWGRLFIALKEGGLPGITNGCISISHVDEVVKAHIAAVKKGRNGQRYILAGENCSFSDFVRAIAEVSDIPDSDIPPRIPAFLLKIYARAADIVSSFTGNEPDITPELAKLMTRSNINFSSEKAIRELDYDIPPLEQSVRDCHRWLKEEGLI